ncbi:N-acetyltransferase family protein [Flavobacterium sp. JP2137]|uniref:GNAT family N-acetyltransferase n=1 Tax=Flavobacterium sp. JP2137 TaxID=3414510 RepID=UPI003D2FBD58
MTVKYRDAVQGDLAEIVAIYNSTIPSRMVTADTAAVTVASKQPWFEAHCAKQRPLWIVESERGVVLAWISFQSFYGRPAYDATAEISIYIAEQQRGKGLGKQLLLYSMAQAPTLGIKTILGFVFAHNIPSLQLFLSLDFEIWGNLPAVASIDERDYDLTILGKRLAV